MDLVAGLFVVKLTGCKTVDTLPMLGSLPILVKDFFCS